MKKCLLILITLILVLSLVACASKKNIDLSKEYIDEYYKNFSSGESTQCYYQLNKNSAEILESKYNVGAEDFLSSRSIILGEVIDYDIQSKKYSKDGDNKITDFDIVVNYKNATINEKMQIIIKNDGQTSINFIEFGEDNVISNFIANYKNAIIADEFDTVKEMVSQYYYKNKTENDLQRMIEQSNELGGKLLGCEVVEGKYIYEEVADGTYVYEAVVKMNYENMPMLNNVKIIYQNENLGIANIAMFPEKLSMFLDNYKLMLNEENKDEILKQYSDKLWGDSEEAKDTWYKRLLSYSEEYGSLQSFDVISIGLDTMIAADGSEIEILRVDIDMLYEQKVVKNKIVLLNEDKYLIQEQFFLDG